MNEEESKKFLEELPDYSKFTKTLSEQEALEKLKDIHKNVSRSTYIEYLLQGSGTQSN